MIYSITSLYRKSPLETLISRTNGGIQKISKLAIPPAIVFGSYILTQTMLPEEGPTRLRSAALATLSLSSYFLYRKIEERCFKRINPPKPYEGILPEETIKQVDRLGLTEEEKLLLFEIQKKWSVDPFFSLVSVLAFDLHESLPKEKRKNFAESLSRFEINMTSKLVPRVYVDQEKDEIRSEHFYELEENRRGAERKQILTSLESLKKGLPSSNLLEKLDLLCKIVTQDSRLVLEHQRDFFPRTRETAARFPKERFLTILNYLSDVFEDDTSLLFFKPSTRLKIWTQNLEKEGLEEFCKSLHLEGQITTQEVRKRHEELKKICDKKQDRFPARLYEYFATLQRKLHLLSVSTYRPETMVRDLGRDYHLLDRVLCSFVKQSPFSSWAQKFCKNRGTSLKNHLQESLDHVIFLEKIYPRSTLEFNLSYREFMQKLPVFWSLEEIEKGMLELQRYCELRREEIRVDDYLDALEDFVDFHLLTQAIQNIQKGFIKTFDLEQVKKTLLERFPLQKREDQRAHITPVSTSENREIKEYVPPQKGSKIKRRKNLSSKAESVLQNDMKTQEEKKSPEGPFSARELQKMPFKAVAKRAQEAGLRHRRTKGSHHQFSGLGVHTTIPHHRNLKPKTAHQIAQKLNQAFSLLSLNQ